MIAWHRPRGNLPRIEIPATMHREVWCIPVYGSHKLILTITESVTREPVYYIVLLRVRLKWANCGNIASVAICGIVFIAVPLEIYVLCIMIVLHHSQQSTCWSGENEAKRLNFLFRWPRREQPSLLNSISALVLRLPSPSSPTLSTHCSPAPILSRADSDDLWRWFDFRIKLLYVNIVFCSISNCVCVLVCSAFLSQCVYSECKSLELHLFR